MLMQKKPMKYWSGVGVRAAVKLPVDFMINSRTWTLTASAPTTDKHLWLIKSIANTLQV